MTHVPRPFAPELRPALMVLVAIGALDAALEAGATSPLASWWTAVGLGVALLARVAVRRWAAWCVALLVVGTVARLAVGADVVPALAIGALETGQALAGALVITHLGRRRGRLASTDDLVALLVASATCGVLALGAPYLSGDDGPVTALGLIHVGAQYAVSTLLLCALVLLGHRVRFPASRRLELVAQLMFLCSATALVFGPSQELPLGFAPLPILVWAALRFDSGVVAAELVGFAAAATFATAHGAGPVGLVDINRDGTGTVMLTYLLAAALTTLPLALTVGQRRGLLRQVSDDEELFRRHFAESPLGLVFLRADGPRLVVDEVNAAATTMLAASHETLSGRPLDDLLEPAHPDDQGLSALLLGEADAWHGDAVALARPGSRLEVALTALTTSGARDAARLYSAQLLDTTMEHDSHRQLADAHRFSDTTLDTTACIIVVADLDGTIVRVNNATRAITGFDAADLVGQHVSSTSIAALTRAETDAMFMWPNRSGAPMVGERLGRSASGRPIRILWSSNVVLDEAGAPSYAVLTGIDVTAERSTSGLVQHLLSASIATALVGVDGSGRITLVNAGTANLLGWSVDELVGRPFIDLFDSLQLRARTAAGDGDAFLGLVGMIGDRDESPARDWTWRTRDGLDLVVSLTLSATDDLDDGPVRFLCVGRDVTAQREGQEMLVAALEKERTAVERLRALDRAKDEFVSTVSHELRTPVTSIVGYTELLLEGGIADPTAEQVPMLDTIARNGQRLITICNDLLLLAGFESEAALGVHTRVDLRSCVTAAHETLPAGHDVGVHVDTGTTPLEVTGDRAQLDRLVANLLGNAVKFTPAGGRVDVTVQHAGSRALLTVRDTGIGIPHDDHDAVFDRFYRTEEAQTRAIPGTGLGLSIVAAIVRAHDATIELESEPGRGTTFRVLLPLCESRHGSLRTS